MNAEQTKRLSKFLSLVLRHQPETIGIELDANGWVEVDTLLDALRANKKQVSREQLEQVVATSDKQRFALSDDGSCIRASQGHSVEIQLGYPPVEPPEILYHGTPERFVEAILEQGLLRGKRHHVHLSAQSDAAVAVGQRRGRPVVLRIRAREMHRRGTEFYVSANGVWLTEHVPPEFIEPPSSSAAGNASA
ncbi:MAG: RNA 2'-phosphotransferase [Pirellulaceae bacterium]